VAQHDPLVTVFMVRRDLRELPLHVLPEGFSIRPYRRGDKIAWVEIERQADRYQEITSDTFDAEFGAEEADLPGRMLFLLAGDGAPIGTATAWHSRHYPGRRWGRVHWVGIVPNYQGRGLAKPLLAACLNRIRAFGYEGSYLTTETLRIPAINLYLSFGFVPDVRSQSHVAAWQGVAARVKEELRSMIVNAIERAG